MKNPVICYGSATIDVKTMKEVTHHVTFIHVDNFKDTVEFVIQRGLSVDTVKIPMEHAEDIGFINFNALSEYCKFK